MVHSIVASSCLTLFLVSLAFPISATAGPIDVTQSERFVQGYTGIPNTEFNNFGDRRTSAPSGLFDERVAGAETETDGLASYQADQKTSITQSAIGGRGSASATVATVGGVRGNALGYSSLITQFVLDGVYEYTLSGTLRSNSIAGGYGFGYLDLFLDGAGSLQHLVTENDVFPFSFSGALGPGTYRLSLAAYAHNVNRGFGIDNSETSSTFTATLALKSESVPDGGDTALLFLLSSAFLAAFALQKRRRAP